MALHKIRVYGVSFPKGFKWYVACRCGWEMGTTAPSKKCGGQFYFGRDTWDEAFAIGIAHQQNTNGRGEA